MSRGITPDIDCGNDNGVSRRHAQLTTDGTRWFVEDLQSSNGTFVGDATGTRPRRRSRSGARSRWPRTPEIYVGSWTRIVLRRRSTARSSEVVAGSAAIVGSFVAGSILHEQTRVHRRPLVTGIPEARRGRVITLVNGLSDPTALALLLGGVATTVGGARHTSSRGGRAGRDGCRLDGGSRPA